MNFKKKNWLNRTLGQNGSLFERVFVLLKSDSKILWIELFPLIQSVFKGAKSETQVQKIQFSQKICLFTRNFLLNIGLVLAFLGFLVGFLIGGADAALLSFSSFERGGLPLPRFVGTLVAIEADVEGKLD